ncbi:hypothetical protein KJ567_07220, partial [Candidatus Bipolaricaulota bacterium]|nr:hypothetical protein [Candidatus Bipolaricaulota bacterium]
MKRIWRVVVVGLALAACAAIMAAAKTYAVYYDCSSGRETVLTIMNAEPMEIEYTLSLFRPIGGRISGVTGAINPYASVEYVVSELLPAGWETEACGGPNRAPNKGLLALCKGGLALLETSGSVLVKVGFADEGGLPVSA